MTVTKECNIGDKKYSNETKLQLESVHGYLIVVGERTEKKLGVIVDRTSKGCVLTFEVIILESNHLRIGIRSNRLWIVRRRKRSWNLICVGFGLY